MMKSFSNNYNIQIQIYIISMNSTASRARNTNSIFENQQQNNKTKYKDLADKWNNIQFGLDREKVQRKQVLQQRLKRLQERISKDRPTDQSRFKLLKQQIKKLEVDLNDQKQQSIKLVENKEKMIQTLQQNLEQLIRTQKMQKQNNEKNLINTVDNKILSITTNIAKINRQYNVTTQQKYTVIQNQLGFIREELQNQKKGRQQNMQMLTQQIQSQLSQFQETLSLQKKIRDESQNKLFKLIEQTSVQLKYQLNVQRKQRESTNQCLLRLLQDTCSRIYHNYSI